ncbi:hypothetical protein L2Z44_04990 [Acinetobacter baumannii]|uniref:hypothetical protein n=1 Tax=Acinetobacter baumannii TaxID=470 RepID=UPI00044A643C|nr:hypothetical protein [Acinetobacter baumannii]EXB83558.1 hypothetical protein J542_1959 [Acinetobacter baumannii 299505]KQG97204.1 hypothetical protein APC57_03545 [Acinetobacter baumannii]MDC5097858.1 hypothetical protein [Acinetobacter baumannii]MDC5257353.1 hypothetical protein [Acinetobacter baumannii]PNH15813.1 hypothetical protein DSM30011_007095 [Acinetobacter baumannii]
MSEIWSFDYKDGWQRENDFIDHNVALNNEEDISKVLKILEYNSTSGIYAMNDNILGDPIKIYVNSRDSKNTTLPKYLIEFSPIGDEVEYLGTRNLPSLIELLNKLTPLVTATTVCDYINDKYAK